MEFQNQKLQEQALNTGLRVLAVLIPLLYLLVIAPPKLPQALLVFSAVIIWTFLFKHSRLDYLGSWENGICTASLLVILLPASLFWWQTLLVVSFGVVIGEQIFGGRGYSFTSPVIVALAFQFYSFIDTPPLFLEQMPVTLLAFPLMLLLWTRKVELRALVGIFVGYLLFTVANDGIYFTSIHTSSIAYPATASMACLLYTVLDPIVNPRSKAGRWLYGLLIGSLQYTLDSSVLMLDKTVFACLLGTIAVPLIDWAAVSANNFLQSYQSRGEQRDFSP